MHVGCFHLKIIQEVSPSFQPHITSHATSRILTNVDSCNPLFRSVFILLSSISFKLALIIHVIDYMIFLGYLPASLLTIAMFLETQKSIPYGLLTII